MSRWGVRLGGYPHGWGDSLLETDDAEEAIARYELERARLRRMTTVAIFDDARGEGEPLDPDAVRERLEVPLCQDYSVAGPRVPFHRVPGINPVKCWFLNAAVERWGPAYDAWLSAQEDVPAAERAAAVARFAAATYDAEGPPLVCVRWRAGDGERDGHGLLLEWGETWTVERADGETFQLRPQDLVEAEVVDA